MRQRTQVKVINVTQLNSKYSEQIDLCKRIVQLNASHFDMLPILTERLL